MERSKAKEAGRRKVIREKANALKDKPPRKAPAKEAIKQAGRYHAIETAKKHLTEAQQAVAPDREQQPYTAVDKVETYTANIVHEVIQPPDHPPHRQHGNVSHRETHSHNSQSAKAVHGAVSRNAKGSNASKLSPQPEAQARDGTQL